MTRFSFGQMTAVLLAATLTTLCGCGVLIDKDRIKIAKKGDKVYTRGDLYRIIREMPDEERSQIGSRSDYIRVIRNEIDREIKVQLGQDVEKEMGKPLVTREQAMQQFFARHPEENYQLLLTAKDPAAFEMSQAEWESAKEQLELEIDKVLDELRGDAAIGVRAVQAIKNQTLDISDADFQREYDLRKEELKAPEWIHLIGIRFKTSDPGAETTAADVRRRLDAGESFDAIVNEFAAKDKEYILDTDIQNSGSGGRFANFWHNAAGAKTGDILGPIFMPACELVGRPDQDGKAKVVQTPDAYLVFRVAEHSDARELTLEEAKPLILPALLMSKMTQRLREVNGVEIFEEQFPDPALFMKRQGDPIQAGN